MMPMLSILIVNWNHRHYLENCLEALLDLRYQEMEILIADNASTDSSVEWLAEKYPDIYVISLDGNLGFSRAFNVAAEKSRGSLLLSINPDVVVRPGFISEVIRAINVDDRIGIVAPKLLRADNPELLDSTGLFIDRRRRPFDRGQGSIDLGQFDGSIDVFGACGAAALYRREMLEDIRQNGEYFDEDFFAYYEDADISWRARLRGWRAVYAPRAVATHVRSWGDTLRKHQGRQDNRGARLALGNRYLMVLKNDTLTSFTQDMPFILSAEIPRLVYMAIRKPTTLLGISDFFRKMPSIWRKRRNFHQSKSIDNRKLRQWFLTSHC